MLCSTGSFPRRLVRVLAFDYSTCRLGKVRSWGFHRKLSILWNELVESGDENRLGKCERCGFRRWRLSRTRCMVCGAALCENCQMVAGYANDHVTGSARPPESTLARPSLLSPITRFAHGSASTAGLGHSSREDMRPLYWVNSTSLAGFDFIRGPRDGLWRWPKTSAGPKSYHRFETSSRPKTTSLRPASTRSSECGRKPVRSGGSVDDRL